MNKKHIALLFGGRSSEHEVSCMSAVNVAEQIDTDRYELLLIGITEEGRWVRADSIQAIRDDSWRQGSVGAVISPDTTERCVLLSEGGQVHKVSIDVAFPVLHGLYGEDGTVQGLLELAGIPYVGCGVLASALSMDKLYTKIIVRALGIRQADYIPVMRHDLSERMDQVIAQIENQFSYPVFIKPSNAGSSRGVSKAGNCGELRQGLIEAAKHDRKLLVEETICGREVECAVLGGGHLVTQASGVGEILAAAAFYDFEAKYYNQESKTVIHPDLPGSSAEDIRRAAVRIFDAVDGYGLSRVDFFVTAAGEVVFNEINTMPGFTAISMYPKLWEAEGLDKRALINRLIELAFER